MDDKVDIKYCDTQHSTLDKRIDRIDSRLMWILFFMIVSTVGLIGNIFVKAIPQGQVNAATK